MKNNAFDSKTSENNDKNGLNDSSSARTSQAYICESGSNDNNSTNTNNNFDDESDQNRGFDVESSKNDSFNVKTGENNNKISLNNNSNACTNHAYICEPGSNSDKIPMQKNNFDD